MLAFSGNTASVVRMGDGGCASTGRKRKRELGSNVALWARQQHSGAGLASIIDDNMENTGHARANAAVLDVKRLRCEITATKTTGEAMAVEDVPMASNHCNQPRTPPPALFSFGRAHTARSFLRMGIPARGVAP